MSITHDRPHGRQVLNRLLGFAAAATTPLLPTDYLELIDPLRLSGVLRGRIVSRRSETPDAATLVIRPGRGWRPHVPGQYVRVGVDVDGVRHWRSYSLTSPVAAPDGCLAITVKRIGRVSSYLVDEIAPGTLVQLDQATGDFVMPRVLPEKVLFLTAGSGITPVVGMLRNDGTALADVHLLHSAPTAEAVLFRSELQRLAAAEEFGYTEWLTGTRGRLDLSGPAALDGLVPDWRERHTWACGPAALLDAAEELWRAEGIAERLHTERFQAALAPTGEGGVVTFARSEVSLATDGGMPLLDAGEDSGVLMPSGCRMGICFGCTTTLMEGNVRDLRNGTLTTAAPGEPVVVQTCINAAAGPCTLDL